MKIIDEAMMGRCRQAGACEWCHKWCKRREPHHVFARGHGGGFRLDVAVNLVGLCAHCHLMHHNGRHPFRDNLLEIVAKREGMAVLGVVDEIYYLMRLPKGSTYAPSGASSRQGPPHHADQRHGLPDDLPAPGPGSSEPGVATF